MCDKGEIKDSCREGVIVKRPTSEVNKRLYDNFASESANDAILIFANKMAQKVSQLSVNNPSTDPPRKQRRKKVYGRLDEQAKAALRNIVFDIYRKREIPTDSKILKVVKERQICRASLRTMERILEEVGFYKMKDTYLMEKLSVSFARCRLFDQFKSFDFEKAVFLDETWVGAGHTNASQTSENMVETKYVVAVHAGSSEGFVKDGLKMFQWTKKGDYKRELSCSKYKAWFQSMLENIEPNSVIVLANRVYNTTQIDKPPSISNSKQEIIDWLTDKNIDLDGLDPDPLVVELLHLVKKNKPPKRYELDEMAAESGHRVVRLPPFGFYFNAINVVWTQIKDKIAERNNVFTLDSVEKLFLEAIAEVTPEDWRKAVLRTKQVIEQANRDEYELDDAVDDLLEQVINPALADRSDSEFSDSDSDSEDSVILDYFSPAH